MGSALLYFAIVVMWLIVLLPMWLRRDRYAEDAYHEQPTEAATDSAVTGAAGTGAAGTGSVEDAESGEGLAADGLAPAEADTVVQPPGTDRSNDGEAAPSPGVAAGGRPRSGWARRRARTMARRRRRLLWTVLLVLASVVTAAVRVVPWWAVAPSGMLLVGYLAMLRVAAAADRERRDRAARARAERLRVRRERRQALAAMAREAEIIRFDARKRAQVFDQYADGRRAVGD